jgi:hypothetical protein
VESHDNQTQALRESLNSIADDICQLVIREQQVMCKDFTRMSTILQEAATNLRGCFGDMNNHLARQSGQLQTDDPDSKHGQKPIDSTDTLSSKVVRSLQFEDIMQQMIIHSRRRAEEIERLFVVLTTHIKELDKKNSEDSEEILKMLTECIADIDAVKKALGLENPVKHLNLNQGDIELF